jgi:2-polyprenyl-6-methoxyphenol hydroxylase-like FAD-dependent oxidoreductase
MATSRGVIIVGAGPAGATLAYLLARRGVGVTLLEKHANFDRVFRGEGLQQSGIDAFEQMGLGSQFAQLPQVRAAILEVYRQGRPAARVACQSLGLEDLRLVSQPALLEMLVGEACQHPSFRLEMGATVHDLLHEGGRVVGVRVATSQGTRDCRADLVVGTDGRHAVTRKRGDFAELRAQQRFDILWVKVPFPACFPDRATARVDLGPGSATVMSPSPDGALQIAFMIRKGEFPELRALGVEAWTERLIARVPAELAAHLRAHREAVGRAVLLDVVCGRLTHWTAPGLLLIGDAAHPMSPVGGQGINLALRDALVAANHLCPALTGGADAAAIDRAARRVEEDRLPEIAAIQDLQQRQAALFFDPERRAGRLLFRLFPLVARAGLIPLLLRRRMSRFAHGVVPIHLEV